MKVLIIGATGRLGSQLVEHALEAGHEVTAFARNIEVFPLAHPNLRLQQGDVLYPALIEAALAGQDAVLSVIGIRQFKGPITLLSTGIRNIISAMENKGVKRLITITGAGILQENDWQIVMESLSFPPNLQNISLDHLRVWELLKISKLDWTIVCPAFMHLSEKITDEYLVSADYYPKNSRNEASVRAVAEFMIKEASDNQFLNKRVGIASPID
ncbi:MAG: NAD(P)-dependent oxidoreductase [Bacteroidia bacterium]